jgi:hypothetical protein
VLATCCVALESRLEETTAVACRAAWGREERCLEALTLTAAGGAIATTAATAIPRANIKVRRTGQGLQRN